MSLHGYAALILIGWGVSAALLFALYLHQSRTGDATLVDAGWGTSLILLAAIYATFGPGELEHRILIASMAGLENLRIAYLVLRRVGKGEDPRYQQLRVRWRERGREQLTFAIFYQAQALVALVLGADPPDRF